MTFFLITVAIVATIVVIVAMARAAEKRRTEAFEQAAQRLGYRFDADASEVRARLGDFHLFRQGHSRRARRLLAGETDGGEIWIFDYKYTVGGGKSSHTYRQTVAVFPSLEANLPEFQVRPENVFHKIGSALGYQDIDLDDQTGFSSRYLLRGHDESGIRQLFTPERVAAIMKLDKICIEGGGPVLVFYRAGRRVGPEGLETLIEEAGQLRAAFTQESTGGVRYRLT